jgi:hypothetical protein
MRWIAMSRSRGDLLIVIVPHQALDPENLGEADTALDWLHVVQARCG